MKKRALLTLTIVGFPLLLGFLSAAVDEWHYVFDDAFITYRYSKNLALGHGITWNPGATPTEGYTNFLLVVFLAPFIKLGCDPLLITRIASYLSAFAIAGTLFLLAKRRYSCSTATATLIGSLVLLAPPTRHLCLVGLETVIYALLLLLAFHASAEFLRSRRTRTSVLLSVLTIAAMLLRPEAVLLYVVTVLLYCMSSRKSMSLEMRPLFIGMAVAGVLGLVYLVWKCVHFGQLLPNPFYIKASGHSLISRMGLLSVIGFVETHSLLLSVLSVSIALCLSPDGFSKHTSKMPVVLGLCLVIVYSVLFVRTDTLMDINGRFMFPLLPVVIYASVPILASGLNALERWTAGRTVAFVLIAMSFLMAFGSADLLQVYGNAKRVLRLSEVYIDSSSLTQRELGVAQSLAEFPGIDKVRIAFGDSGVIPYYTGALWLDVVGLNDSFIARTKDKGELLNYFFSLQPDLVIHPGQKDFSWIRYGHGPLGDCAAWATDPRWDEYVYVGTCRTGGDLYNLQFLVRRSSHFADSLSRFLKDQVVDGQYDPLPYPIGTYTPDREMQPTWVPRTEPRG